MTLRYLSVSAGIEAATEAWHPLGWSPFLFSEIAPFPSAVLAHHYPHVPNLGDMTRYKEWPNATINVLVGGTPCQSFSIAGLRKGLDDPRGNLALTYCAIADKYQPEWFVWENVPGVLSSDGGRAFGSILGAMVELGYHVAYRVLDAQYVRVDGFGRAVPQRRRRVFVVGNSRNWRRAAEVLFERESLSGNPAPRRETGQRVAPTISARPSGGGGLGTDFDCDGGLIASTEPIPIDMRQASRGETMTNNRADGSSGGAPGTGIGKPGDPAPTIASSHTPAIAFDCKASGRNGFAVGSISPTLRSMGHANSHQNACGQVAVAIQERAICENPEAGPDGIGVRDDGTAYTLEARTVPQAVAFDMRGREGGAQMEGPHDTANIRAESGGSSRSYVAESWAVRRLTPTECERLQGFPDGYTNVPWRGKDFSPDGPRYKALGNSMAVNVMRWIGTRIDAVALNSTAALSGAGQTGALAEP